MADKQKVSIQNIGQKSKNTWVLVIYSTHMNLLLGDMMSTISTAIQRSYTVFSESSQRQNTLMKRSNDLKVTCGHVWWDGCLSLLKQLDWVWVRHKDTPQELMETTGESQIKYETWDLGENYFWIHAIHSYLILTVAYY